MRRLALLLLFASLPFVNAQQSSQAPVQNPVSASPQPESQLSPQAAYDQAIRPLEITRRSPQNWSEVELAALKVAREQAKPACAARNPDQLSGDDLLALAHLCAFAQLWQPVHQAAANYLAAAQSNPRAENTQGMVDLATAFDYKVQASLNLDNPDDAILTSQTMLRTVPYDEFASEATNSTLKYIHFIHTDQALALLALRQPILLALIKAYGSKANGIQAPGSPGTSSPGTTGKPNPHPPLPLHALYADAIALPAIKQFANQPGDAARSYTELEAALPDSFSSEDGMFIAEKRRQYLLFGTHLPIVNPMGALLYPGAPAPDNLNTRLAYAKVFLLFPDWCNQCVAMGFNSTAKAKELLDGRHVLFIPLLAQADPPEKPVKTPIKDVPLPAAKPGKGAQSSSGQSGQVGRLHVDQQLAITSTPDARLEGTPTVVVPNETMDIFAATDFPLIVAADHNGIIRDIQVAPEDAFVPGGDIDQIVQHILATWPPD